MTPPDSATSFDRCLLLTLTARELTARTRSTRDEARVLRSWAQAVRRRRVLAGGSDQPDTRRPDAQLQPPRGGATHGPSDQADLPRRSRSTLDALWLRGLRVSAGWRYSVAILAALVTSLVRVALNPWWGTSFNPYIFFFPAILFSALFAGLRPAWMGIAICGVAVAVWILPPTGSLAVSNPLDLVGLAVFIVIAGLVAWIGAAHRDLIRRGESQAIALVGRQRRLERAVAEAETANQAKDDFLAVLSHELRTPLATIVAGVRMLHKIGSPDDGASRAREAIERQANHLVRLVDDLLDMKSIVTGVVVLESAPCDLADTVSEAIATLNGLGRFKSHAVSLDAEPAWINGDPVRLQQLITNLLGNAVKYTPAGGSIFVSVKHQGEEAVLRVRDTGIGINPDLLPRLFELFVQGDPGPGRVRSGLGVGLAVVRRLVELHGGSVEASSDGPGTGSTFTVRLPRLPAPSA